MIASAAPARQRLPAAKAWSLVLADPAIAQPLALHGIAHLPVGMLSPLGEARLLVSCDIRSKLPLPLRGSDPTRARYTVLATSTSDYVIVAGDGWQDLPHAFSIPEIRCDPGALAGLQTISLEAVNEGQAVDVADATGILEHFAEDNRIRMTMLGRERTGAFSFRFDGSFGRSHVIHVDRAQMELDRGGESTRAVYLIEAKKGTPASFHIRQIFYPLRAMTAGGSACRRVTKPIVSLVLLAHNGAYTLLRYAFDDPDRYHSIRLIGARRYVFAPPVDAMTLADLIDGIRPGDSRAPMPLGDPDDAIAALEAVAANRVDRRRSMFAVPNPNGAAMAQAAGLLQGTHRALDLSVSGFALLRAIAPEQRNTLLARAILRHPVLHEAFCRRIATGALTVEEAEEILARYPAASSAGTAAAVVSIVDVLVQRPYARP